MTEDFSVGMHIKRLHELMTLKANQMFRRYDLTLSQAMILVHCVEQKTEYVMQKELETTFGLSHATISGLLKRLSENGFLAVCISEEDKRQRKVYLTKKAQRMAEQLQQGGKLFGKDDYQPL
ncbi:MAG: MarR family transcriptional regulator [Ruminococcaceae bacterium]|nr:MarR family transcriptional regulator [Oscillospiraceae bacterium]